jgi:hypothetical protein
VELDASPLRDGRGLAKPSKRLQSGSRDIDWVRASQRLCQNVSDSRCLDQCADRATRDDSGTWARRLHQHFRRAKLRDDLVRNGRAVHRHKDQTLASGVRRLANRVWDLVRLSETNTHMALTIADDDQGAKAEPPTAFDDFGDPVHADDFLP